MVAFVVSKRNFVFMYIMLNKQMFKLFLSPKTKYSTLLDLESSAGTLIDQNQES